MRAVPGDRTFPSCALCWRTATTCVYPSHRKPRATRIPKPDIGKPKDQAGIISAAYQSQEHNQLPAGQSHNEGAEASGFCDLSDSASSLPPPISIADIPQPQASRHTPSHPGDTGANTWNSIEYFGYPLFDGGQDSLWSNNAWDDPFLASEPSLQTLTSLSGEQSEPLVSPQPDWASGDDTACCDGLLSLDTPGTLVIELVHLYFEKVHPFLYLFHRPRFIKEVIAPAQENGDSFENLSLESSLILNGMLALAARYSTNEDFKDEPPVRRGDRFGKRAKAIYDSSMPQLKTPNLRYLQGMVLLAFYSYSCEPDSQGWLVIGMCSRLAYDLSLNNVDANNSSLRASSPPSEEWSREEERRRTWWCIWELDTFASAISCRPPTIDKNKIQVMLPVSDETWFADIPVVSAIIDPNPVKAWRTLENSANQDVRAWFLVSNFLLLLAHEAGQRKNVPLEEITAIETAVTCFSLLVPSEFHATSRSLSFSPENYCNSNWVISLNMMIQGARVFVKFLSTRPPSNTPLESKNRLLEPLAAGSHFQASAPEFYAYAREVFNTIQLWSPAYIALNTPYIICLVIGPAAINLRVALQRKGNPIDSGFSGLEADLILLVLKQTAKFWGLGLVVLDIARRLCNCSEPQANY